MKKSELRRKKVRFLCHWFGIKSFPLPQKEQQVLKDRSTLWAKYSIYKGICTNITQSLWQLFWFRLKLKLRDWNLYMHSRVIF